MSTLTPIHVTNRTYRKRQRYIILFLTLIFAYLTLSFISHQPNSTAAETIDYYLSSAKQALHGGVKGWQGSDWGFWGDAIDGGVGGMGNEGCGAWVPEHDEIKDPEDCLMARQYRQVARVLAREELLDQYVKSPSPSPRLRFPCPSSYFQSLILNSPHWYFTVKHNKATLHHLLRCFTPPTHPDHISCPHRPLALVGWWYGAITLNGATTGESVWLASVFSQLKSLGIEWLAVGPYKNWIEVAEMMPDV